MTFQNYPFFYLFFISAAISALTSYLAWKRQNVRSARTFSILMILVAWWIFFYGCEIITNDPSLHLLFLYLEYLAIPWISGFLVLFSLEYGGYDRYITRKNVTLIFIIPFLIFLSFYTDPIFHLYYKEITFLVIDNLTVMSITPSFMHFIMNWANNGAILFCFVIVYRVALRSPQAFRSQMFLSLCAIILLIIGDIAYFLVPPLYPDFDILPIIISFIGVILLISIFRYQLFDLIHIPYHTIFEYLQEGIIVLDPQRRIIEINQKARELLRIPAGEFLGVEFKSLESALKEYSHILTGDDYVQVQIENKATGQDTTFMAEMYPIKDSSLFIQYRMIIIRDITDLTKTNKALGEAGKKLNLLTSITRHDILNQTTIISGYTELIQVDSVDSPLTPIRLTRIGTASDSIQKLIRFTATYQDLGVFEPEWQYIPEIAKNAWNILHPSDSVILEIETDLVIFADMLLEKVFFNLMENSLRHGETVSNIRIFSYETSEGPILVYSDDGRGVEPDKKEMIFSKGFGKNSGYGLFLVSEILSITGISIRETGYYGSGVRFEILIPPDGRRYRNPD